MLGRMLTIGTLICGSSSRGTTRSASSLKAIAASRKSRVSGERIVARVKRRKAEVHCRTR